MTQTAHAHFAQLSWDEREISATEQGPKLATGEAHMRFTGDMEVETSTQGFILYYDAGGTGHFTGFEQLHGSIGGRRGTVVLQTMGAFTAQGIDATWKIVDGSGTGELTGITGNGGYLLPWGSTETDCTLDFAFPTGTG